MDEPSASRADGLPAPGHLLARIVGVVFSPAETYAVVAARPRVFGALAVTVLVVVLTTVGFMATEVGREAFLDLVDERLASFEELGIRLPDAAYEQMEASVDRPPYQAVAGQLVFIPALTAGVAGLIMLVFSAMMGGEATYRQVLAIVSHSGLLMAMQALLVTPLNYVRGTMSSGTHLGIFVPMLSETNFLVRMLSWIDLVRVWWLVNLSIGIGVLYRRRAGPIATALLALYVAFAVVVAAVVTALSGV
jgi:hypothetical protein